MEYRTRNLDGWNLECLRNRSVRFPADWNGLGLHNYGNRPNCDCFVLLCGIFSLKKKDPISKNTTSISRCVDRYIVLYPYIVLTILFKKIND
jgi:hypothetical protein